MSHDDVSRWTHHHEFDRGSPAAERSTRVVMWITAVMMVIEVTAGWWFNSMALLADGWHMSSHAMAIGLSVLAYSTARRLSSDRRFAFGTWKIEVLGGFASAIVLLCVAVLMLAGSIDRIITPQPIQYREAILIAVLGLLVNVVCAVILGKVHHHPHSHGHGHGHDHDHHPDLNLKAAYLHVIADAATSILAIFALVGGWLYGWAWLDPAMGIVGAVLVASWARGLISETGKVLLDREMDHPVVEEIREAVTADTNGSDSLIVDLHVWRVGRASYSCALTVVTNDPKLTADVIRGRLAIHEEIAHSTIEVHIRRQLEPMGLSQ
jgi:cation diffusion facilitator family transporter